MLDLYNCYVSSSGRTLGFLWWVWFRRVWVYGVHVGRIARLGKLECRFPIYLTNHMVTLGFKYEWLGGRCGICGWVNYVGAPCPQDHIRTTLKYSRGSLAVVSFCGPPFPFTPLPMVFRANACASCPLHLFVLKRIRVVPYVWCPRHLRRWC